MPAPARWCWTKSSFHRSCARPSSMRTGARTRASDQTVGGTMKRLILAGLLLAFCTPWATPSIARERWTPAHANAWYAQQKWLVGSNYIPADAINELEMWQEASFDPGQIDKELAWAQG